ncbi:hypothetical protein LPJ61_004255 [Coemansia biformis]|uniref:Uncharacterized protein n=1 Tax=Coemansia biformis TaxID=1286918 RepID=A0A9W8CVI6_9FUNG|nr:hypothetical protein LPJ61_004255 [Coemansia biformis]
MKEASGAIQDLMRDTARLLDQACKINAYFLQLDTSASSESTMPLLASLEQSRAQYRASLAHVRSVTAAAEASSPAGADDAGGSGGRLSDLQRERDSLREESCAKSEEMRRLLDCMRQIQLTSAQLVQL